MKTGSQEIVTVTQVNVGVDSKGEAFGLSGNQYLLVLVNLVVGIGIFLLGYFLLGYNSLKVGIFGVCPVAIAIAYVFLLQKGKPRGYDRDFLELLMYGPNWTASVKQQMKIK